VGLLQRLPPAGSSVCHVPLPCVCPPQAYPSFPSTPQGVQNTVVLRAGAATDMIQNCLVRANFVVSPGHGRPNEPSSVVVVPGPAVPTLLGTSMIFQVRPCAAWLACLEVCGR
jgi:hypothetical protein